jgi:methylmalonyl-CoA/ethylmalonyl-CoA epimerase
MRLEHIGIAVEDLEKAIQSYETLLNTRCYKREKVEKQQVETAFLQSGESKIELLGATDSSSVIRKFLSKKGEGLHHMAFEVEDIYEEIERLTSNGYTMINEEPQDGADNKLIAFLHPKENHGVLVELCQSKRASES